MRIFQPLKDRRMAFLFGGQIFSCIGDEIYNVAMIWFAVSLIGEKAGYLAAIQAAAILIFSLMGGLWAEHHESRKLLIWADLIRGMVVLIPVIWGFWYPPSLWILVPVAIIEASFNGLFNATIRAWLPEIIQERTLMNAANGLIEVSIRIGRVLGPGLIATLGKIVPLVHFFTLDALSFFVSAWALGKVNPIAISSSSLQSKTDKERKRDVLFSGVKLAFSDRSVKFGLLTASLSAPTWYLSMPLGMALLVHEKMPDQYDAMGLLIATYGIGNIIGNLISGSSKMEKPHLHLAWGRILGGLGFFAMACAQTFPQILLAAVLAATGGPTTDLGLTALIQRRFSGIEAIRVFRFQLAYLYSFILMAFLVSPYLFETFGVARTMGYCGVFIFVSGVISLIWFPKHE